MKDMKKKTARVENLDCLIGPSPAVLHYLRRQGWRSRSIARLVAEYQTLRHLLASDKPWIDDEVRAGLGAAAEQTLLGLAAIPAATLAELETKVAAYEMGQPSDPLRQHVETMLDVAILADVARLKPVVTPPWLARWVTH